MILGEKVQYWDNKEEKMKPFMYYEHTYKISNFEKPLRRWYRMHPYAKRINKKWICNDYRIDQQRPQRNVYSERYIKIVQMSEMEANAFDKVIKDIEKDINYPTVWDDGKNRYYEDTIHCPICGKRRKVLTSKTHCEFCGFEFSKAKKCPKCKDLNLMNKNICEHCGHDFNSKIKNNDKDKNKNKNSKSMIICSECKKRNNQNNNYCIHCGHKLKKIPLKDKAYRKYCEFCGKQIKIDDNYCSECGSNISKKRRVKVCSVCGEWCSDERYCWNCGHNNKRYVGVLRFVSSKKCPNCNSEYTSDYNYCDDCGTKLIEKESLFKELIRGYNTIK